MKRFLVNTLLAAAAFAAIVLVLEGVLRTTHVFGARLAWTEPDSLIAWRFSPGSEYWYLKENDHAITGRINSHGWRDRDRTLEKPSGTYRVAVIGDSFVEAFQVELESTFVAIAERDLNGRLERPVEVMNFGRAGMTQSEELLVLDRDVWKWSPDVVVIVFVPQNDVADVHRTTTDNPLRPFFFVERSDDTGAEVLGLDTSFNQTREFATKVRVNALKRRSALVSLVAERYNAWRLARRSSLGGRADPMRPSATLSLCTSTGEAPYEENYRLCKRLIAEASVKCEQRRCDFLLVAVPWVYEAEAAGRYRRADASFDPGFFDADLRAWAGSVGVDFLGLQRPFERYHATSGERLHWDHLNYRGHRLAGELLARRLSEGAARKRGN